MLRGNMSVLNKSHARFTNGTATAGAYAGKTRSNFKNPSALRSRDMYVPSKESLPGGYNPGQAITMPRSAGGLASQTRIVGEGALTATIIAARIAQADLAGTGQISDAALKLLVPLLSTLAGTSSISDAALATTSTLAATIAGTGTISSANLKVQVPLQATLAGTGAISAGLKGYAALTADITPFTELSPQSLASAVWTSILADYTDAGTAGKIVAAVEEELAKKLNTSTYIALK